MDDDAVEDTGCRTSRSSSSVTGARGGALGPLMSLPRKSVASSGTAGIRASLGCASSRCLPPVGPARGSTDPHRHSPGTFVCRISPLGNGWGRLHAGHDHVSSGSAKGWRHGCGTRVCVRDSLCWWLRHAGHVIPGGRGFLIRPVRSLPPEPEATLG